VMYIKMNHASDYTTWKQVAKVQLQRNKLHINIIWTCEYRDNIYCNLSSLGVYKVKIR